MAASATRQPYLGDDGNLRFYCNSCGQKLKVPPHAIGKRVKCRGCATVLAVPKVPTPATDDLFADDGLDDLGDLAGLAGGNAVDAPRPAPPAPTSGTAKAGATRLPNALAAAAVAEPKSTGGAGLAIALPTMHPLLRGTIGCAIGCAIGVAIWVAVAIVGDQERGFIAWGVGLLAGFGMYLGARDPSLPGAVVAGAMAGLAIVVAKTIIVRVIFPEASQIGLGELMVAVVKLSDWKDWLFYVLAVSTAFYRSIHGSGED